MSLLETDIQGLIGGILEVFPPEVTRPKKEGEHPKALIECFIQTIQRQTALHPEAPEHRNL